MSFVVLVASFLATLIPTLVYVWLLGWFDRFEKIRAGIGIRVFLWGILPAVILALLIESVVVIPFRALDLATDGLVGAGLIAPLVEEPAKAAILFILFWRLGREHDNPLEWIIYGALAGYGFALNENVLYFIGAWLAGGWTFWSRVVYWRAFFFGMNHALFTSVTGLGLGLARVNAPRFARIVFACAGLGAAMLFHAAHNLGMGMSLETPATFQISALVDWSGVAIVVMLMALIKIEERTRALKELREELEIGLIDAEDYAVACSMRARLKTRVWGIVNRRARRRVSRLAPLLADLAFAKHQTGKNGRDYSRVIRELRIEIAGVRAAM